QRLCPALRMLLWPAPPSGVVPRVQSPVRCCGKVESHIPEQRLRRLRQPYKHEGFHRAPGVPPQWDYESSPRSPHHPPPTPPPPPPPPPPPRPPAPPPPPRTPRVGARPVASANPNTI